MAVRVSHTRPAQGWAHGSGVLTRVPASGSTCLPVPPRPGTALPLPSSLREGKSSFNFLFPGWALFFFPPPLDLGRGNKGWRPQS